MEKNKPIRVLWHGNVKASIWANKTQNGEIYSANYARIYTDKKGQLREAYTFSGVENLRLEALARQAGDICNVFQQESNARNRTQKTTNEALETAASVDASAVNVEEGTRFQMSYAPAEK